jgi:hypothetical protein
MSGKGASKASLQTVALTGPQRLHMLWLHSLGLLTSRLGGGAPLPLIPGRSVLEMPLLVMPGGVASSTKTACCSRPQGLESYTNGPPDVSAGRDLRAAPRQCWH